MAMTDRERLAARIIRRHRRMREEIAQIRRDVRYWNTLHPESPMEEDPDGQLAAAEAMLERMETLPPLAGLGEGRP